MEWYKCHCTRQKGTFGNDRYILYLDCDNENILLLNMVVVTGMYIFVKTYLIVYFKYTHFVVCKLSSIKFIL